VSVDDVVRRAQTSHGTFYLYFSNKEDLFKALLRDALHPLRRIPVALAHFWLGERRSGEVSGEEAVQAREVDLHPGWERQPGRDDDVVQAAVHRVDDRIRGPLRRH
jgi:AcrR family transcriptional regulator